MRSRLALASYAVGLVVFAAFVVVPFVTKKRDIPAEVPSPPPLTAVAVVNLPGMSRMCMTDLAISAESRVMHFKVGTYGKPGPPLGVSVQAPGYSSRASVPSGFADNLQLSVPIARPPSGRLATVCIRNLGHKRI